MYPLLQLICRPCSATVHDHAGDFLHHFFYEGSCYSRCIFWPLSATVRMWGLWSRLDDLRFWHCLVCGEMGILIWVWKVVPRIPYLLPHVPLSANKFSAFLCHCGRVSASIWVAIFGILFFCCHRGFMSFLMQLFAFPSFVREDWDLGWLF